MEYTLYSGTGVLEENLVCSDVSRKFLLGVFDHIFSGMEDDQVKKFTIVAKKTKEDEVNEEENYIHSSGPEEDESETEEEELELESVFDSTDEDII